MPCFETATLQLDLRLIVISPTAAATTAPRAQSPRWERSDELCERGFSQGRM
jgi:hypothetical protein